MSGEFEEHPKGNQQAEGDVELMDFHLYSSPYEYGSVVFFNGGQKRNLPTCATALAVPFAVTVTTLAVSLPATLALWPTTSPANEGTARQPVSTTRAKSFFIFPPSCSGVVVP
jgi:hypothetical protein